MCQSKSIRRRSRKKPWKGPPTILLLLAPSPFQSFWKAARGVGKWLHGARGSQLSKFRTDGRAGTDGCFLSLLPSRRGSSLLLSISLFQLLLFGTKINTPLSGAPNFYSIAFHTPTQLRGTEAAAASFHIFTTMTAARKLFPNR